MTEKSSERTTEDVEKSADQSGDRNIRAATYFGPCDLHPDETE